MTGQEKKRKNTISLPTDLLVEILSRVPEASLARLRSTSKEWNALIKKEVRRAKKSLVVMLIDYRVYLVRLDLHDNFAKVRSQFSLNDPLSSSSEEVDVRRVCHCDGLLLCTTMDERLVVWNPCSGETSRIVKPLNSHHYTDTYALGKSSCNNEYKISRVHHPGHGFGRPCLVKYEIYDFTSNLWRLVGETREWSLPGAWQYGTSVDGNTYWLSYDFNQACPTNVNTLGCFDFTIERFGCVSLPVDPLSYYVYALSVTREEQKLCLLTYRYEGQDIDIWMATKIKITGDMSWSKLLTVKRTHPLCNGMSFLADRENKVLVCPTKYKNSSNCLHIVGTDKYIQVDHHDVGSESSLPYRYDDPTLVQIQRGSLGLGTWKAPMT
ncbi:hypothetical protein Bca4012_073379 [Brassica carinata]|uniref:F-box domain-containing protein n=4 Tax=Brassica TaxID=3705 RepID=A0A0D3CHT0_BRAOL|nr:putative F-box protein At4g10190 [Brassica napus]KAG2271143.1 hypothetical protein Bca52824_065698 [Brassica carinata]CAF1931815.1 unnamed protein product [Brassica napus]VDD45472.1 unnamed protein product [Brassica oleracea]